jgi:ABC-2 type transport system permease protein
MTSFQLIKLVMRREIVERLRQRVFLVSTLITLLLIVGGTVIPSFFDKPSKTTLGVTDAGAQALADTTKQLILASDPEGTVTIKKVTEADGRLAVKDGDIDTLLSTSENGPPLVIVNRRLGDDRRAIISGAIQQQRIVRESQRLGITDEDARSLLAPGELTVEVLDPPDPTKDGDRALAFAGSIFLFMQLLQFGMAISSGVVEEKSSRVQELLLGRMKPRTLLAGKLLGIGLVGFAQLVVFAVLALTMVKLTSIVTLSGASWKVVAQTLLWFIVGYASFSGLYLIAGALAGRQEDLQSTTGLALIVAMGSYFASIFAAGSPDAVWARILSVLPFSGPLIQPVRFAEGEGSVLDALFAIGLSALAIWGLVRLGEVVYKRTMLSQTQTSLWKVLRSR